MPLHLIEKDITAMETDAIVNSTNPHMIGISGVDRLIHDIGGDDFERECMTLENKCRPGEAVWTNAYNLKCKYIIHTISFPWEDGIYGETAILKSCYRSCLEVATELGCKSVAFPLISSGNYRYPIADAIKCAVTSISEYLKLYEDLDVYLVLYGEAVKRIAETIYGDLDRFVEEQFRSATAGAVKTENASADKISLEKMIAGKGESFVDMFYRLMRERGIDQPSKIYKAAGITKSTFSKLMSGGSKKPSLETAAGLALALKLSYEEATEFLASAGLALSDNSKYDLIIKWFLQNGNYNIWDVDVQLAKYGYRSMLGDHTEG